MSPRIFTHQVGRYEVRCPYEDAAKAARLWEAFQPTVQMLLTKMDKSLGRTAIQSGLPEIRGAGVVFEGELLTAYGEGFSVTFLDPEGLREVAGRLKPPAE